MENDRTSHGLTSCSSEMNADKYHLLCESFVLDEHRAQERIKVCFDGDASRLLDRTRIAIPVDDKNTIYAVLEETLKEMNLEIDSIDVTAIHQRLLVLNIPE